jgi:hypothetical protein
MKHIACLFTASLLFTSLFSQEEAKEINPPVNNAPTNSETVYMGNGDLNKPHRYFYQKQEKEEMAKQPIVMGINNPTWGYVTLDFLAWRAQRTSWYYAVDLPHLSDNSDVGQILYAHPKWKPGFRLDLNFSNVYDWTIGGVLTYYYNNSTYVDRGNYYHSAIYNRNIIDATMTMQSKITFISGDFEFGTNFNFGKTVSVKPFISLRVAQFKDDISFYYNGFVDGDPVDPESLTILTKQKFTGAGPRVGLNSEYRFGNTGLDLFGLFTASLLYGNMKVDPYSLTVHGDSTSLIDYKEDFSDLKANIQLILGSKWKYFWDHDTKAFMLRFAWEANYWFDQGDYYRSVEHQNQRALIFSGFNVGFGFEY